VLFARKQQVIPPPMPVGAKLDHFEVIDVLEQSTRSHVYLAKDQLENKLVIIKAPSVNFSEDEQYLTDFVKEGWIGQKLNHPSVMKIYEPPNSQFIYHACEYIEGQTLAVWSRDNPKPSLVKVRDLVTQLVASLRVLQRFDVVHCDIKADNFMIDGDGRIKLIDFGSCEVGALEQRTSSVDLPKGTLNFTAPELFLGQRHNHQSDLFSLAVLVYQLLTGQLPYKELSQPQQAPSQYNLWRYVPITTHRNDLPDWLDVVLSKALAPNPKNRYLNYSEFVADLDSPIGSQTKVQKLPLIERDPVRFWQGISAVLLLLLIVSGFS